MARNRMHKCWDLLKQLDIHLVRTSLDYTKQKFSEYDGYPTHEYKLKRVAEVDAARQILLKINRGGE